MQANNPLQPIIQILDDSLEISALGSNLAQVLAAFAYSVARTHPDPIGLLRAFEREMPAVVTSMATQPETPQVVRAKRSALAVADRLRNELRERGEAMPKD